MLLILTRDIFTTTTTLGRLAVQYDGALAYGSDGWHAKNPRGPLPFCFVCEDEDRGLDAADPAACKRLKVKKETAIPVGSYEIRHTWSPKYEGMVMEVLAVPAFQGIRIHTGNDEGDTEGCIIPGLVRDERRGFVLRSTQATTWLCDRIRECGARGEKVTLQIRRDTAAWNEFQRVGGADGKAA